MLFCIFATFKFYSSALIFFSIFLCYQSEDDLNSLFQFITYVWNIHVTNRSLSSEVDCGWSGIFLIWFAIINVSSSFRQKESQASQQGQIHCQDVPEGRLRHFGFEESSSCCGSSVGRKELNFLYLVLHQSSILIQNTNFSNFCCY